MMREAVKMFMDLSFNLHELIEISSEKSDLNLSMVIDDEEVKVIGWRSEYGISEIKIERKEVVEHISIMQLDTIENIIAILKEIDSPENFRKYAIDYNILRDKIIEEVIKNKSINDLLYLLINKSVDGQIDLY